MSWRNWGKGYGIHLVLCITVASAAFGVNQRIDIERRHEYTVSEPSHTLLKEITEAKVEKNTLVLSGWGFDMAYYGTDSQCDLILQDVDTGEALWPKMRKSQEPAGQIPESCAKGGDYASSGFEGSIPLGKLEGGRVYEVLVRYALPYIDEAGRKQQYALTATTGKFVSQGQMTDYNPKTFVAPEITGAALEKELEGAKLFHYFPEGMWVYYDEENLYYIMEDSLAESHEGDWCYLHWRVRYAKDLPEDRRQDGFGNSDFPIVAFDREIGKYKIAVVALPSRQITYMDTGIYGQEGRIFGKERQLE